MRMLSFQEESFFLFSIVLTATLVKQKCKDVITNNRRTKPKDSMYIHDPENSEDSNVALEKLRDVIAQCILPQAGENEDEKLNEVMQEAWKYNRECKLLRDTLQTFSWNGRGFTDKVDRLKLAEIVKQVIEEQTNSHDSQ